MAVMTSSINAKVYIEIVDIIYFYHPLKGYLVMMISFIFKMHFITGQKTQKLVCQNNISGSQFQSQIIWKSFEQNGQKQNSNLQSWSRNSSKSQVEPEYYLSLVVLFVISLVHAYKISCCQTNQRWSKKNFMVQYFFIRLSSKLKNLKKKTLGLTVKIVLWHVFILFYLSFKYNKK